MSFKLPSTPINTFRSSRKVAALSVNDNDRFVELHIPGLIDPSSVTITLKNIDACAYAIVRGEYLDSENYHHGIYRIENHKIQKFEDYYPVPVNAEDPMPKAELTIAKDNCGNVTEGVLTLEWTVNETNVPITIKDCAATD